MRRVVDGCDGPGHPNAQENVHSVAPGDVPDGRVRILVLRGCYLAGKCVCKGKVGGKPQETPGERGQPGGQMSMAKPGGRK